jgi:hypothetical protein
VIRKGSRVLFEMTDGSDVIPKASHAMLHDPSGKYWPARSVLVGPIDKGGATDEAPKAATQYLGRSYRIHEGSCALPPRALGEWEPLGDVECIYYHRHGNKARGRFRHEFNRKTSLHVLFKGKRRVRLYGWGDWCRLELPRDAVVDDRGLVFP